MQALITWLPVIHLGLVLLLLAFVLLRSFLLIKGSARPFAKNSLNVFSFLVLAVFFSGIAYGFILKIPFSHPYILTKIIGFLGFVALNLIAFTPARKTSLTFTLVAVSMVLFVLLFLVSP